jgi:hypothetical protein
MKQMKKLTGLLVMMSGIVFHSNGQWAEKTIDMGAGYANQIYYSMENGVVKSTSVYNWDLAFNTSKQDNGIRVNHMNGVEVFMYEKGDTGSWSSFDTTGWNDFPQLYNSDTSMDVGAFNRNIDPSDPFDFSWGKYNVATHIVTGDSLYLLVFRDQSQNITGMKKFWIVRQTSSNGNVTIKMADVDGTNEYTEEIQNKDGAKYNFTYYNLRTNKVVDRAPEKSMWDVTFARYFYYLGPHSPFPYYQTTGVISNIGVKVTEVRDMMPDSVHAWSQAGNSSANHFVIGNDWKSFDNGWALEDSLSYIIYPKSGDKYFHIYFSDFQGSATGVTKFMQSTHLTSVGDELETEFAVYPNPADGIYVRIYFAEHMDLANIDILDISGKVVASKVVENAAANEEVTMPIEDLSNGYYFVRISSKNTNTTKKLVINK